MNELLINLLVACVLSMLIAGVYYYTHRERMNIEMLLTIIILPLVVTMIIYTIGSNVAGAFSLSGIFSIVRFRSEQASFKDITYILFCVAIGLSSATGFYLEGLTFTIIAIATLLIFYMRTKRSLSGQIEIVIPEDMQNKKLIEAILQKYCQTSYMTTMRTRDLGSLYEYRYQVSVERDMDLKEMIDELRIINSNLPIKVLI